MSVEQLSRNANRNLRPDLGGSPTTIHVSPPGTPEFPTAPYLVLMHRRGISCEKSGKAAVNFRIQRGEPGRRWGETIKVRHRALTAHARARYRCFLPDLAGLAGVRRVRPMPDLNHSSIRKLLPLSGSVL